MDIKAGVNMNGIQLVMRQVLVEAEKIWNDYGVALVITSCVDGTHSAGSYHYYGLAVDFRTRSFDSTAAVKLAAERLRRALGINYDVVIEKNHLHVEYDPK